MIRLTRQHAVPALVLVLLLFGATWVTTYFWGNPWVRMTMSRRVTDYLSAKYPTTRFTLDEGGYDFLSQRYVARIRAENEPAVVFYVDWAGRGDRQDDYREQKLATEMVTQLSPVVHTVLPAATVNASALLPPDSEYGEEVRYTPETRAELQASVSWNVAEIGAEEFVAQSMAVLAALRESGLRVDEILFWCTLGERNYALDLTREQQRLSKEQLLLLVSKPGKW